MTPVELLAETRRLRESLQRHQSDSARIAIALKDEQRLLRIIEEGNA